MGKVKLTLTVDEQTVINAKAAARRQHLSLSQLIEDLLLPISRTEDVLVSSTAADLRGIAKSSLTKKTDRQTREMMYKDRHGI